MATKSIIATLSASHIQSQINDLGLTRETAAASFGFSNPGALGNALKRYHPDVVFYFSKPAAITQTDKPVAKQSVNNGNGFVAASIVALHKVFSSMDATIPALESHDFPKWISENQEHGLIAALDGTCDISMLDCFCSKIGVSTPRHARYVLERDAKNAALALASVKSATQNGRFVVGPMGGQTLFLEVAEKINGACKAALTASASDMPENAVSIIASAKSDLYRLEQNCVQLAQAARLTLQACRIERNKARESVLAMEAALQPIIAKLATEVRYTQEQSAMIAETMKLVGMSSEEAIALLKSRGKL
jgi:hypothetical protein